MIEYWSDELKVGGLTAKVRDGEGIDDALNDLCQEIEDLLKTHGYANAQVYRGGDSYQVKEVE